MHGNQNLFYFIYFLGYHNFHVLRKNCIFRDIGFHGSAFKPRENLHLVE